MPRSGQDSGLAMNVGDSRGELVGLLCLLFCIPTISTRKKEDRREQHGDYLERVDQARASHPDERSPPHVAPISVVAFWALVWSEVLSGPVPDAQVDPNGGSVQRAGKCCIKGIRPLLCSLLFYSCNYA